MLLQSSASKNKLRKANSRWSLSLDSEDRGDVTLRNAGRFSANYRNSLTASMV
jgi:hypothetical protein